MSLKASDTFLLFFMAVFGFCERHLFKSVRLIYETSMTLHFICKTLTSL